MGEGWSLFLERYVTAFFREVLGITPETETLGGSVTFTIDISKLEN